MGDEVELYGTLEPAQAGRQVRLGPLSFLFTNEAIRRICWHGTELVRAVAWPIRDENWGTYAPHIRHEAVRTAEGSFACDLHFDVADGRLDCRLAIRASAAGSLALDLTMTPQGGAFATNRSGFTVLHPIKGFAGEPLRVTHSDGSEEETEFPRLISPGQPVFDIRGLSYGSAGKRADMVFGGEVFEMEDQRNWSDASYKTYCVPLVFPFVYQIEKPVTQSVQLTLSGAEAPMSEAGGRQTLSVVQAQERAPDIGLVAQAGWTEAETAGERAGVQYIAARVAVDEPGASLSQVAQLAQGRWLDLEVVLPGDADPVQALTALKVRLDGAGITPARIMALPEPYLGSHQPSGPWPDCATPGEAQAAARSVFAGAKIGGGMLTNFTEFNRCRPDPEQCDYITHGNTAVVHAGDDLSVRETLEALPQLFASARAIGGAVPYRLGLVAIGMRTNPYGAAVAENPGQIRQTMAREDPRHRGLFGAAYAVGVLAGTLGHGVEALCLAAPSGPFGLISHPQPYPQPHFDDRAPGAVYPLFHVVREAAGMAGAARLGFSGLPDGVFAYGAKVGGQARAMIANMSPTPAQVPLDRRWQATILDAAGFKDAAAETGWLDSKERTETDCLTLAPFAVAFSQTDLESPAH